MRYFLFVLLLFTQIAFAETGPTGRSVVLDGTGAQIGVLDQYYLNVQYYDADGENATGTDGSVLVQDVANYSTGYNVTDTTTTNLIPHCVLDETCSDGKLCRCQIYGYKSNVQLNAGMLGEAEGATAGDYGFISESGGTAGGMVTPISKLGNAYHAARTFDDYPVGEFLESATASGDVKMLIRLR